MQSTVTKSGKGDDGYWRINEICIGTICNDVEKPGPWKEFIGKPCYRVTTPIANLRTSRIWPTDSKGGWYLIPSKDPKITRKLLFLNMAGATAEQMQDPKIWEDLTVPHNWCIPPGYIDPDSGIIPICKSTQSSLAQEQRRSGLMSHPRKQFQVLSFSSTVIVIVLCLAIGFTAIYNLMGTTRVSLGAAFGE